MPRTSQTLTHHLGTYARFILDRSERLVRNPLGKSLVILSYSSALLVSTFLMDSSLYMGYHYEVSYNGIWYSILGIGISTLAAPLLPSQLSKPSQLLIWFLYFSSIIPSMTISFVGVEHPSVIVIPVVIVFISWILLTRIYFLKRCHIVQKVKISTREYWWGILLGWAVLLLFITRLVDVNLYVPTLQEIYEVRSSYQTATRELHPLLDRFVNYSVFWLMQVVSPFFVVFGLLIDDKKGYILIIAGMFTMCFVYALAGYKTVFFILIALLSLHVVFEIGEKYIFSVLSLGLVSSVISTLTVIFFTQITTPVSLVRRLLVTPGIVAGYYFEYFSSNPKTLMGSRPFMPDSLYPYEQPIEIIIGQNYFPSQSGVYANANLWAEGFATFGLLGIPVFTILLGVVLYIYDTLSANINYKIGTMLLVGLYIPLANTDLVTLMITHGLWLQILILYLYPWRK